MKVSLNPVNIYKNKIAEIKNRKKKEAQSDIYAPPTLNQIRAAKTKKTVSECFWIALGLGTLYFIGKKKAKDIRVVKEEAAEIARQKAKQTPLLSQKKFAGFVPFPILPD